MHNSERIHRYFVNEYTMLNIRGWRTRLYERIRHKAIFMLICFCSDICFDAMAEFASNIIMRTNWVISAISYLHRHDGDTFRNSLNARHNANSIMLETAFGARPILATLWLLVWLICRGFNITNNYARGRSMLAPRNFAAHRNIRTEDNISSTSIRHKVIIPKQNYYFRERFINNIWPNSFYIFIFTFGKFSNLHVITDTQKKRSTRFFYLYFISF